MTELINLKTLVGLISHNRLNMTLLALETMQHTRMPFDLLIVDNGSENDAKKALSDWALQHGARFFSLENRNCNGARDLINHYGLAYDYVVYADNDVLTPEGWLEQLLGFAEHTKAALLGVSQSAFGGGATFFGTMRFDGQFIIFDEDVRAVTKPELTDWVTGHCLTVRGDFLRTIWSKFCLWERRLMFPIDLDDIDLMMMARNLGAEVYVAPVVVPQNRNFGDFAESSAYNCARNDFHNYALSCVSFWDAWGYNPLLNWNKGYTGNANKPGKIYDATLQARFLDLVEMVRGRDAEIYASFCRKLCAK